MSQEQYDGPVVEQDEDEQDVVAIRRNVVLSGAVGGAAVLFGVAYLIRAGSTFEVLVGLLLLAVAAMNLPALASARTPVLVADGQGIRLRVGLTWRGLPWESVRQVVVEPPRSRWTDGRLVIVPRDRSRVLRRLGTLAELHLRWNKYFYGASLSVPLGMTTLSDSVDLAAELVDLADGRVEIVHLHGRAPSHPAASQAPTSYNDEGLPIPDEDDWVPSPQAFDETAFDDEVHEVVAGAVLLDPVVEVEPVLPEPVLPEPALPEPVLPLRAVAEPNRVDVRLDPEPVEDPEARTYQDEDAVLPDDVEHTEPVVLAAVENPPSWDELPPEIVIDDLADRRPPVLEPLIGAKVAHARECLDMSIEELSQRTRIRPHVLEAIERDDFDPCGGDFYARGHLTAISRALGLTLDPLLAIYDERYAQAPINARRVFEAELSTGLSGGMRATLGSPRWSLLIGSVLCLTMVWGLARIFAGDPEELNAAPETSHSAGLAGNQTPITSPKMKTSGITVRAAFAPSHVAVKDRDGHVLWSGDLAQGKTRKIVGLAPFKVVADNAGAIEVIIKGKTQGVVGTAGAKGSKTFGHR
ncbi:cytoskeleton protein RodZ [Marmoricola sp. OAE513]|uniref:RodZ domain-containing protein n=1 Tax=Marmoricola sp. OAE513 TaxID=2817894 RepID=UPI001AE91E3C